MRPRVFWFFGRSGAGKTTLCDGVSLALRGMGIPVLGLDGDAVRRGLCKDLGFSTEDRLENHRRMAEVARLAWTNSHVVLVASMAPSVAHRKIVDDILGASLAWIHVDAPLDVCMRRDPKSLYAGEGKGTVKGLSSFPFDPVDPDRVFLHLKSDRVSEQDCIRMAVERILSSMGLPGNSPGME